MNNRNMWNFLIVTIFFISALDAQCRRGEKLRISNGVETQELDCRDATRLIYNEGWYPYSIDDERDDRCPQLASSACLLYTSPSPRDGLLSRMPSSA